MSSQVIDKLSWRYAVKVFDNSKEISSEKIEIIKKALILTPSSFGLQPWKFLFITNKEIREKLKIHSWNQSQITDASHLIVILCKENMSSEYINDYINYIAEERNIPIETLQGYAQMMNNFSSSMSAEEILHWNKDQTYIALGFLLSACAMIDIDSCPMEGFDKIKYNEILNLKGTGYTSSVICPVGYRDINDPLASLKKIRFTEDMLITDII